MLKVMGHHPDDQSSLGRRRLSGVLQAARAVAFSPDLGMPASIDVAELVRKAVTFGPESSAGASNRSTPWDQGPGSPFFWPGIYSATPIASPNSDRMDPGFVACKGRNASRCRLSEKKIVKSLIAPRSTISSRIGIFC